MNKELIVIGNLRPEKGIADKSRVFDVGGVSPTILATHYKDPPKILERKSQVLEIGNLKSGEQSWKSPQTGRVYSPKGISPTLNTCGGGGHEVKILEKKRILGGLYINYSEYFHKGVLDRMSRTLKANKHDSACIELTIVASRGRNPDNPSDRTTGSQTEQRLEPNSQGICNTLTSVQKDNLLLESVIAQLPHGFNKGGYFKICPTITGSSFQENNFVVNIYRIRKLTPKETWRLMDFSDKDFDMATQVNSKTQLYKQAGNSIVRAVLMAIFSQLNIQGIKPWNDRTVEEREDMLKECEND